MFLCSWVGLPAFWVAVFCLHEIASNYSDIITDFFNQVMLFVWRDPENTTQFKVLSIAMYVFLPAIPGRILLLIEHFTGMAKHFKTKQEKALEI
ncbi:hypothetical protein D9M68_932530 [compost metagenome]